MDNPPILFDRAAVLRNRRRAEPSALFLHEAAIVEIEERLKDINRTFTDPLVVSGHPGPWAHLGRVISDEPILELQENAHDLIVHAMCLHWAEDPVGQLVQCRRALRPDGVLIAALLGGQTLHELRAVMAEVEIDVSGGLSPRIAPMGEIRDLGGLLQRAGFALPVADGVPLNVEYGSVLHLMRDLRAMGETNAMAGRIRHATKREVIFETARRYSSYFANDEGRIPATFETIYLTGWAPDDSQPQPLRPGSAQTHLADALAALKKE